MKKTAYDVIIVGGGASGLFCAANLLSRGASVLIFEPNRFLGRKLRITGKGRCNLTNNCTPDEVMKNIVRNPNFLYSALSKMPPERIMSWFEAAGVPLKTERGRRVFPVSDSANDVAEALCRACDKAQVIRSRVDSLICENGGIKGVLAGGKNYFSKFVVLATGGKSYPRTGSDGSGYSLASAVGHTVTPQSTSLVPVITEEKFPSLGGFLLKNVSLCLYDTAKSKKPLYQELGEFCLEPYGLSGAMALSASCFMEPEKLRCKAYRLDIDFKPGLTREQLEKRILRDISSTPRLTVDGLLCGLLPKQIAGDFASRIELDGTALCSNMNKQTRDFIIDKLKHFTLTPTALCGFDQAIITRGGVSVREIEPATMESKLVNGLYFTGEIIDCDGLTGGYNLTVAFSTAFCAAENIISKGAD